VIASLLPLLILALVATPTAGDDDDPALKELAARQGIALGANFPGLVHGKPPNTWEQSPIIAVEQAIAERHFAIMSAGWDFYPGHSWTGPGQYDWRGADAVASWCRERGIAVHGHGLGYGVRVPWLLKLPAGTDAERAALRDQWEGYVRATAARFAGRVAVWDVCNEQLLPAYRFAGFQTRQPYWKAYQANPADPGSGVEWYRRTFRLAHEADPNAKLVLLEFNNEVICPKSDQMFKLMKQLLDEGVPVHGAGFQMHLSTDLNRAKDHGLATDDDYFASLEANFKRFATLGVELWITELDVKIDPTKDRDAELARQADIVRRVVEIALRAPNFKGLKFWGIVDRTPWGQVIPERPNLFDEDGRPKPAFFALREALAGAK
jgi:endo-1,4-beta-xylanase